jgi:hypothetical protein
MALHDVLLALHIAAGVAGLALGAAVIWTSRVSPALDGRSAVYPWAVLAVSLTAVGLLALDWPELWWIGLLAALAYLLALLGYLAPRRPVSRLEARVRSRPGRVVHRAGHGARSPGADRGRTCSWPGRRCCLGGSDSGRDAPDPTPASPARRAVIRNGRSGRYAGGMFWLRRRTLPGS